MDRSMGKKVKSVKRGTAGHQSTEAKQKIFNRRKQRKRRSKGIGPGTSFDVGPKNSRRHTALPTDQQSLVPSLPSVQIFSVSLLLTFSRMNLLNRSNPPTLACE